MFHSTIICRIVAIGFALLQHDPPGYISNNIDSRIWMRCYYKEISKYRQQRFMSSEEYLQFLQEAINNYEYIFSEMKKSMIPEHAMCSYSLLIHIGDLYRYVSLEDSGNRGSLTSSEQAYSKAITLDPSQGNAYHQLAILATYKKSYCRALYYCIRAITCSTPFLTALSNIQYHFVENKKSLSIFKVHNPILNKRHCNEV